MDHVMIDLETAGTRPYSKILSVGAVEFDPAAGLGRDFYLRVHHDSITDVNFWRKDLATLTWWQQQAEDVRREAWDQEPRHMLRYVLASLARFYSGHRYVWSHGVGFDIARLELFYDYFKMDLPWHHAASRDTRTVFDLFPQVLRVEHDRPHHALGDARAQALQVCHCMSEASAA